MKIEDWPAEVIPKRIGNIGYRRQCNDWFFIVDGKWLTLAYRQDVARKKWLAFMAAHGHPRPQHWFAWDARRQQWRHTGGPGLPTRYQRGLRAYKRVISRNRGRTKKAIEVRENAIAAARRLRDRRRREINEWLKSRKCDAFVKGVRDLKPTMGDLRMVSYRQHVTPMQLHKPTASWYCWVGTTDRKLVMLGQKRATARKTWLLLRHCLEGGSRILLSALQQRRVRNLLRAESERTESGDHP